MLDGPPSSAPVQDAVLHALRFEALLSQELHRLDRHDAVGSAAVRDDLASLGQLTEALLELVHGDGESARNVAGAVLELGTNIEHHDIAVPYAPEQLITIHGLHGVPRFHVLAGNAFDLGETGLRQRSHRDEEAEHVGVCHAIFDIEALLLGFDEVGGAEDLKVL
jgi:hypothetical protein